LSQVECSSSKIYDQNIYFHIFMLYILYCLKSQSHIFESKPWKFTIFAKCGLKCNWWLVETMTLTSISVHGILTTDHIWWILKQLCMRAMKCKRQQSTITTEQFKLNWLLGLNGIYCHRLGLSCYAFNKMLFLFYTEWMSVDT
jgi:hypothetical protein